VDDLEALGAATDEFVRIVGVVEAAQWALPTPCEEWDVRELVAHVVGEITAARFLQFQVFDVVVHSWDLAAALGSAPRLDEDVVVRAFPGAGLDGVERTPAGSGRGLLDELVGSTGRDLTWAG